MQRLLWSALLFFSFVSSAVAQGNWFVSGNVGVTYPEVRNHQLLSSGAGWPDDRYNNSDVVSAPLLSLEGGYQWMHDSVWLPFYSVGLSYTYTLPAKVKGTVDQYSLPEFRNYNYQYKVQSQTILAMVKADLFRVHKFMPFIFAGAGAAINDASNYSERAMPGVTPRVNPGFNGETNTYFSYALGAGVDIIANKNVWLTVEYEYANLGNVQTSVGANTPMLTETNYSTDRLKTKLTSNSVLLGVTYFFDPVT